MFAEKRKNKKKGKQKYKCIIVFKKIKIRYNIFYHYNLLLYVISIYLANVCAHHITWTLEFRYSSIFSIFFFLHHMVTTTIIVVCINRIILVLLYKIHGSINIICTALRERENQDRYSVRAIAVVIGARMEENSFSLFHISTRNIIYFL